MVSRLEIGMPTQRCFHQGECDCDIIVKVGLKLQRQCVLFMFVLHTEAGPRSPESEWTKVNYTSARAAATWSHAPRGAQLIKQRAQHFSCRTFSRDYDCLINQSHLVHLY